MGRDSDHQLRHIPILGRGGRRMQAERQDARWPEGAMLTAALCLFVLLIFLPLILARHAAGTWPTWRSTPPRSSSRAVSACFCSPFSPVGDLADPFVCGRPLLAVAAAAIANAAFDTGYTLWIAENLEIAWRDISSSAARLWRGVQLPAGLLGQRAGTLNI
jgi:hypothetical protein